MSQQQQQQPQTPQSQPPQSQQTGQPLCKKFYQIQSFQELSTLPCYQIDILFGNSLSNTSTSSNPNILSKGWISHILQSTKDLELAAPCLKFNYHPQQQLLLALNRGEDNKDDITRNDRIIFYEADEAQDWTEGYVLKDQEARIFLNPELVEELRYETVIHEIMHALGFEHTHQRQDAPNYLYIHPNADGEEWADQYQILNNVVSPIRFDPYSVMMYQRDRCMGAKRCPADDVWQLKPDNEANRKLSEVDKVALNLLFGPRVRGSSYGSEYQPTKSNLTGLYYCGRQVMTHETAGFDGKTSTFCGPVKGPNCPTCRVLETDTSNLLIENDKWQGWTGYVYCGKINGNKVKCGPDNGYPCQDCHRILFPGDEW